MVPTALSGGAAWVEAGSGASPIVSSREENPVLPVPSARFFFSGAWVGRRGLVPVIFMGEV